MNDDRRWFKQNTDANIRFRKAVADEAEHLLSLVHPEFKQALACAADNAGIELSVAVLKFPNGKLVRMPVGIERDHDQVDGVVTFALMCVGRRVAME